MRASPRFLALLTLCLLIAPVSLGEAATLRVPQDHATIQAAVDAAAPGTQIRVGPGRWCGAKITKQVDLVGQGGATIIGCDAPVHDAIPAFRIGFFLPTAAASGTTIRHFVFDGAGVSNTNFGPLTFAIFARDANHVIVEQNTILGTIQAVTNTRGSGWTVSHNDILELRVLTCDGFCGGGDAIVFQQRTSSAPRATDNSATHSVITGVIPNNLHEFSMVGILLIGQDGAVIKNNRVSIPANPIAAGAGEGIVVTDHCCGVPVIIKTSINSVIVNNDGRGSEFAVVVERDAGGGTGNSVGTTLRGNLGVNDVNGSVTSVKNRSKRTLAQFP